MLYFIIIMSVVMMFMLVLALYRLHTLDKIEKECKEKISKLTNTILEVREENAKLRTFKYVTESIVTGKRDSIEKVQKIKELLFPQNNNSISK